MKHVAAAMNLPATFDALIYVDQTSPSVSLLSSAAAGDMLGVPAASPQAEPTNGGFEDGQAGWSAISAGSRDFRMRSDTAVHGDGAASLAVLATVAAPSGYGGAVQTVAGPPYRGKHIRLAGRLRTDAPDRRAGLWMRVDAPEHHVAYRDTLSEPIAAGGEWVARAIELDVPDNAVRVAYGMLLDGPGEAWLDDVTVETLP
jgi:hypothetical protein